MYRISLYTLVFVVVMLLQVFIFDRLTFSIIVAPIVYIAFLALLPMQTSQIKMLFLSLILGVVADLFMGTAGLNTIATLFVGYTRIYMMNLTLNKDVVSLGGIPIATKLGQVRYISYLSLMLFTQLFIYFTMESLSLVSWQLGLLKFLASGVISLIFVWLLTFFFGSLLTRKMVS